MKTKLALGALLLAAITVFSFKNFTIQNKQDTWTQKQLMEPAKLAAIINNPDAVKPLIYSIGFEGGIKGSVVIGPVSEDSNLAKFKTALSKLPKNANIVIYCGCCPFEHCPNIRPAFRLLNQMKFTNQKMLNLSHNLRADWISKGYPMSN